MGDLNKGKVEVIKKYLSDKHKENNHTTCLFINRVCSSSFRIDYNSAGCLIPQGHFVCLNTEKDRKGGGSVKELQVLSA